MKINISISLETDGDYSLRNNELYSMECDGSSYFNTFEFADNTYRYDFESDCAASFDPCWRACSLLKKILCDIHVYHTHYYVLDDLYHMFEDAMEAIGRHEKEFEVSISGNYDGTFIEFTLED